MGTIVDLKTYAVQLRQSGKRVTRPVHPRKGATADIHIWDGVRIDRGALPATAQRANASQERAQS